MKKLWQQVNGVKVRISAKYSDLIREAIIDSIDVTKVVKDFSNAHYDENITTQQGRDWARVHIYVNGDKLNSALKLLYAESYTLGQEAATAAIAKVIINKAPVTLNQMRQAMGQDWSKWKPGHQAAANLLKPPNGLQNLLNSRGVTIQGVNSTTLDRIGTLLAKALQQGSSPSEFAPAIAYLLGDATGARAQYLEDKWTTDIDNVLSDSERALMIAETEMSRAMNVANREMYVDSGVELVEWLVSDPCDYCQENADASPLSINDTFPSGDTEPPAHPNCVCDLSPYVVDTSMLGEDTLSYLLDN